MRIYSPRRKRRPGALAPIAVLAIAAGCLTAPAVPAAVAKPAAKAKQRGKHRHRKPRPTYWGAWIGDQISGEKPPWDMRPVAQLQGELGKGMSLLGLSSPFADCDPSPCRFFDFPTRAMENARTYGAIPFFSWSSQESAVNPSLTTSMPDYQLSDVIAGRYDDYIRQFAADARDWGHPFFLRFNWEMNGNWFPWAEAVNGNQPGEYVAAWRHVHDLFSSVGAANATWVWCPYAEFKRRFAPLAPLYPGDEYVDWTCMDGFNWGANPTNPHKWRSFSAVFATTYRHLTRRIAPTKPIILAEMASTGNGRAKAAWIGNMFKELRLRYRRVRGVIWFDQVDRGIRWPLETSPRALRAFAKGIRHRAYLPNSLAGLPATKIGPAG